MYLYAAGVADADLFSGVQLVSEAKTLTESSMTVEASNEEIRAGKGAKLYGRFFHTSKMSFKLTDAMFNLDYIAANIGAVKSVGGKTLKTEQVTATANNSLTVTGTPVDFLGSGTIGWYAPTGSTSWTAITFNGHTATAQGVVSGTTYCVKYNTSNSALETVTVSANIIPTEFRLVLRSDLFLGETPNDPTSGTRVGYVEIIVPRFQLDGALELSMTMAGASTTPLSGEALATYDSSVSCDQEAYYAIINRVQDNAVWYNDLIALAIQDGDIQLDTTTTSEEIVTYAIYKNAQSTIIDPSLLTYTITQTGSSLAMDTTTPNLIKAESGITSGYKGTVAVTVKGTSLPTAITAIQGTATVEYTA